MGSHHVPVRLCAVLTIALLPVIADCGDGKGPTDCDEEVRIRFGNLDDTTGVEDFIATTMEEGVIASAREELLLPTSQRTLHIHGLVARGNGGHNLSWRWHFLPSEWTLTEESTEICDARPSAVEAWLDNMPDSLTSIPFCPLSSYVKAEAR